MSRLGVLATSLAGARPTGLGVYTREILRHTPWPDDTLFLGDRETGRREWPSGPRYDTPVLSGLSSRLAWQALRLDPVARAQGCTLLYSPTHELLPGVRLPTVLVVHDLIPLLFPHLCSRKLAGYFRHLLPRACERAAALIAISEQTKRDLVSSYGLDPARITVIPNGYDRAVFRPAPAETVQAWKARRGLSEYVLYVGRLAEPKNVGLLVEAFARASRSVPHDLVLVGPDEKERRADLQSVASRLGVNGRVKALDYVPLEELPLAYGAASLFVTPSLYEGFGLPPLEAMACGTPVLSSSASSLPEVVGDAGELFDPRDAAALADRLADLLSSPGRLAALSRKGLVRAARFSWEATGRLTREVIDRTIARV